MTAVSAAEEVAAEVAAVLVVPTCTPISHA